MEITYRILPKQNVYKPIKKTNKFESKNKNKVK